MRENLKELFTSTDTIHSDIALRRDLTVYLTYSLGEAIFTGGDGTHIKQHCIFPACQMAFGEWPTLLLALYSYLCTELQAVAFLVRLGLPMNRETLGAGSYNQDVIRSGAAQEIPSEVLEQLIEEEAEVAAWIQAERAKASMESTGKSRPSSEDSGERPDFDGGACTSSNSSHRSKRRIGQRQRDDGLMMPEVPADEVVTDPIVAFEEEPRDSEVGPESPPTDLPEDSDDFDPSMDATFDDASDELMEAESIPLVVEEGCEVTGEVPLSFSELEQGVPVVDLGVGASSTSFDEAEESPQANIPSPAAPIGNSFLITLPTVPDMGC
ncbi:hypothetical protein AAC387_Pa10g0577 [Persea americana]